MMAMIPVLLENHCCATLELGVQPFSYQHGPLEWLMHVTVSHFDALGILVGCISRILCTQSNIFIQTHIG